MFNRHRLQNASNDGGAGGGGGQGGGGAPSTWHGDTHKALVETKGWRGVDDALTSYVELEALRGRSVVLPKDENDAEGMKAFRAKLGVPEKADGYELPQELKDDPLAGHFRGVAHKHGLTPAQVKGVVADMLAAAGENDKRLAGEAETAGKAALGKLQAEWGAGFDAKKELARRAAEAFTKGMDAETMQLFTDAAQSDPRFMRGFAAFGELIQEHPFQGGSGGGGAISLAEARTRLESLQADRRAGKVTDSEYWAKRQPLDAILGSGA
jgi:hypothetical protein